MLWLKVEFYENANKYFKAILKHVSYSKYYISVQIKNVCNVTGDNNARRVHHVTGDTKHQPFAMLHCVENVNFKNLSK